MIYEDFSSRYEVLTTITNPDWSHVEKKVKTKERRKKKTEDKKTTDHNAFSNIR